MLFALINPEVLFLKQTHCVVYNFEEVFVIGM